MNNYHYRKHQLSTKVRSTFRNGLAQRRVISSGVQLYRLITPATVGVPGNPVFGQFWFSESALEQAKTLMKLDDCTFAEAARAKLAVPETWNPEMSHVCKIRMKRSAFAWFGTAKYQHASGTDKKVAYIGNAEQIFIPHIPKAKANDQGDRPLEELAVLEFNIPVSVLFGL